MRLRVLDPGTLATVQDAGRPGFCSIGVPVGGAADQVSLRLGNRILGNREDAAAVELTLSGGGFECLEPGPFVLAGARLSGAIARRGGTVRAVRTWAADHIDAGEVLRLGAFVRGCRAYLCVPDGVRCPVVLGSAATLLSAGFGGIEGRPLRRGDEVESRSGTPSGPQRGLGEEGAAFVWSILEPAAIRAVDGAHAAEFDRAASDAFWSGVFEIEERSDRQGLRLRGPRVGAPHGGRMTTEGMMHGAVQVPPAGGPIVLMADHPTTGGYPVIACVVRADLPALGQRRPRDPVRFERVTLDEAWALSREQSAREARATLAP